MTKKSTYRRARHSRYALVLALALALVFSYLSVAAAPVASAAQTGIVELAESAVPASTVPATSTQAPGGTTLLAGQSLRSPDGVWSLTMQDDGNAVLYGRGHVARWSTETNGTDGSSLEMQPDGNLVLYAPGRRPLWASGTQGHRGAWMELQNDGNLVLYAPGRVALWATGTHPRTTYVALGDSYSSGEGNPPFDSGTATLKDPCHRSQQAWPRLLGVEVSGQIAANGHLACSGAVIDDVLKRGQHPGSIDATPQVTRLAAINSKTPVGVVSVTIGGNDLGFSRTLAACFLIACVRHPADEAPQIDAVATRIRQEVVPAIRQAAPEARVIVVGYPRIVPRPGTQIAGCRWLSATEILHLNQVEDYLDGQLRAAATAAGATYVSVAGALAGHELCTKEPWIFPIGLSGGNLRGHPLPAGQRAMAAIVGTQAGYPIRPPAGTPAV